MNILLATDDDTVVFSHCEPLGKTIMAVLHKETVLLVGGERYRVGWRGDSPEVTSEAGTVVRFYRDGADLIGWAYDASGTYTSLEVNRSLHPALGVALTAVKILHATGRLS